MKKDFREAVLAVVRKIPRGKVLSYGEVATLAGFPHAARAVGSLMAGNRDPQIPCHRVVKASGEVGNYNRGETPDHGRALKIAILRKEGVRIVGDRVIKK